MPDEHQRLIEATERWLRREGMPASIRGRRAVAERSCPAIVLIGVYLLVAAGFYAIVAATVADSLLPTPEAVDRAADEGGLALATLLVPAVAAVVAAWAVSRWIRRRPGRWRRPAGLLLVTSVPAVGLAWGLATADVGGGVRVALQYLASVVVVVVLVRTEIASLVLWAARQAVRNFSDVVRLTSRALPLLLLFVTFLFINTENWQVASALTRTQLWGVAAFFGVCLLLFLAAALPKELARMAAQGSTSRSLRTACRGTPLATVVDDLERAGPVEPVPLGRIERLNLLVTTVLRQAIQAGLVGVVVWVFFVLFGKLAIRDEVITSWTGRDPEPGILFPATLNIALPVSQQLVQVSVILGAFSALYFGIYAVTDSNYREHFLDGVLADVGRATRVRDGYLALRGAHAEPPSPT